MEISIRRTYFDIPGDICAGAARGGGGGVFGGKKKGWKKFGKL